MVKLDIKLDVSKKFMIFTFMLIGIFALFAVSYAGNGQFNLPLAWVLGPTGNSVDVDNNGQIDKADDSDKLDGFDGSDFLSAAGATGGSDLVCITDSGQYWDSSQYCQAISGYNLYKMAYAGCCWKKIET